VRRIFCRPKPFCKLWTQQIQKRKK
jgi:hypothetical protein